jgi:ribosome-associated protein
MPGATMARIPVTRRISIDETELSESFVRSSGAGGQNIQKVETAVQLRFDAAHSPSLPEEVRERLLRLAGHRATLAGEIIIIAQRHRTQLRNREDALERLLELIREAAAPPPPTRRATRPTRASKERRLEGKARRSRTKNLRSGPMD